MIALIGIPLILAILVTTGVPQELLYYINISLTSATLIVMATEAVTSREQTSLFIRQYYKPRVQELYCRFLTVQSEPRKIIKHIDDFRRNNLSLNELINKLKNRQLTLISGTLREISMLPDLSQKLVRDLLKLTEKQTFQTVQTLTNSNKGKDVDLIRLIDRLYESTKSLDEKLQLLRQEIEQVYLVSEQQCMFKPRMVD